MLRRTSSRRAVFPDLPIAMNTSSSPGTGPDDTFEWPGASGPLTVRLYTAGPRKSEALLVFFPPGGFLVADLESANCCLKAFAERTGVTVLAPRYAVAPQHPFPAAIEDSHAVLKMAAARGSRLRGWTGRHLVVGGIEAGGNLAAVSTLMSRDRLGPKVAGQVLLMPMLDPSMREAQASPTSHGMPDSASRLFTQAFRDYLPRAADRVHPYACPLESSRLAGLPPALIVYAENDPLAPGARTYADKLERAGVQVQRTMLPAGDLTGAEARCSTASREACCGAVEAFLAPFVQRAKPYPSKSVASVLLSKTPEAPHD